MQKSRLAFLSILFLLVSSYFALIFGHRMPPGHDTWQYLTMQYGFLNQKIQSGIIAQWLPLMTEGSLANWWFAVQAGFLQLIYLAVAKIFIGVNFLKLFHLSMLFDEIVLLVGTWILSGRYYKTLEARIFTAVAIVGSAIWMDQVWLNFHSYFVFPFILEFFHRFIEKRSYRYFFLGSNLIVFQIAAGLPYLVPYLAFITFLYFLLYYLCFRDPKIIKCFRSFSIKDLLWIGLSGLSLVYLYEILNNGMSEVVMSNLGRSESGGASDLVSYFEAGGYLSLHKFLEMLIGVSTSLNQTMYAGVFVLPFVLIALTDRLDKICLHLALFTLVLILFTIGTNSFIDGTVYYTWPGMNFMRYLGLTGSFPKIFLCFISGLGVDFIVLNPDRRPKLLPVILTILAGLILVFVAQCALPGKNILGLEYYSRITLGRIYDDPINLINRCLVMAFYCSLAVIVFITLQDSGKKEKTGIILLLAVHAADIFGYKFHINYLKSIPLNKEQYEAFNFQKFDYQPERISNYHANPRYEAFNNDMFSKVNLKKNAMDLPNDRYPPMGQYGSLHWCFESFLNIDSIQSPFRTDFWMRPLDKLMHVYWKNYKIEETTPIPTKDFINSMSEVKLNVKAPVINVEASIETASNPGLLKRKFLFPFGDPAIEKMAGFRESKIQFFSTAYSEPDEAKVADFLGQFLFTGDSLIVNSEVHQNVKSFTELEQTPKTNTRIYVEYEVTKYDWDHINIHLKEPAKLPMWLFYSDVWNPSWKASIGSNKVPILKANIAYKAVQLNPGDQDIRFEFKNQLQSGLIHVAQLNALMWVGIFCGLLFQILLI